MKKESFEPSVRAIISRLICILPFLILSITARFESLIELSLELSVVSVKAFTLFTNSNLHLISRLIDSLAKYAPTVFASKNPILLNRFALLTQLACLQSPDEMTAQCGYIFDFISFCQHRSVFDMFASFLPTAGGEKTMKLRLQLKAADFPGRLLEALRVPDGSLSGDPMDPIAGMLAGVFRLIQTLREDGELGPPLGTRDAMSVLTRNLVGAPFVLLNAQWDAVRACLDRKNAGVLTAQLTRVIGLVRPWDGGFFPFQSTILRIVGVIVGWTPGVGAILLKARFARTISEIVRQFPEHGILHGEVTEFVLAIGKTGGKFARELVTEMLTMVVEGMKSESVILRAFAWNFQTAITELGPETQMAQIAVGRIRDETDFVEEWERLDAVIHEPFGGEVPPDSDVSRSVLTPQQVLEVLRQIQGGRQ
jgi:hypothetical protein